MNGYGTEVKLLAYTRFPDGLSPDWIGSEDDTTEDPELLIEYASRLCVDKVAGVRERDDYIADRIRQGHLSVMEHASASWWLKCSRVTSHQLVRHRIAAISQRSQRFVREDQPRYMTPPGLGSEPLGDNVLGYDVSPLASARDVFTTAMANAWEAYAILLQAGVSPDDARYVLPNATETQLVETWNFRETLHIIKLRTSPKASLEMQELIGKVQDICVQHWPKVFGHV